jgi:hypothetical protein
MSVAGGRLDVARGTLRYGTSHVRTSFGSAAFRCRREADQIPERHGDDLALLSRQLHGRFVQRLGAVGRGQAGPEAFASSPRMRAQSALSSAWATVGLSLTTGAKASGERANVVMPSGPVTTEADRGRPSIREISPK